MKAAIIGMILILSMAISLLTHTSISDKDIRMRELEDSVATAARQTVESMKIKQAYEFTSADEVVAEFNRMLLMNIDADNATITVRVMGVNVEAGFLDVEVTSEFKYANGVSDEVSVRKSVIYEEIPE